MFPTINPTAALASFCAITILFGGERVHGQIAIHHYSPTALHPTEKTRVEIIGSGLDQTPRLLASDGYAMETITQEAGKLVLDIQPKSAQGETTAPVVAPSIRATAAIWLGNNANLTEPILFVLDSLATLPAAGDNTSLDKSQQLTIPCAVEGQLAAKTSHFYTVVLDENATLGLELFAQRIGGTLDGVLQIRDSSGRILHVSDDTEIGPDPSLDWIAPAKDRYTIEVYDSRHQNTGRYRLRITPASIDSSGFIEKVVSNSNSEPPTSEQTSPAPLSIPTGLAGTLSSANEVDRFQVNSPKGQPIRLRAAARSIGSSALVKLRVAKQDGTTIAESSFQTAKEAVLDFTNPTDEPANIEISEWLGRSGRNYSYFVEVLPRRDYEIFYKPDPALKDSHLVEPRHGAIAVTLGVERLGYDGPIVLSLPPELALWKIHNPQIPAGANEARIYLQPVAPADVNQTLLAKMLSTKPDAAAPTKEHRIVRNDEFLRVKYPSQLYPKRWAESVFVVNSIAPRGEVGVAKAKQHITLPDDLELHEFALAKSEFEPAVAAGAIIASVESIPGWTATGAFEGETIKFALRRGPEPTSDKPSVIAVNLYHEHEGLGRIQRLEVPIRWLEIPESVETYPSQIALHRLRDEQRVLLFGLEKGGYPKDRTADVSWTVSDPNIAEVRGNAIVPKADGSCQVVGTFGKHQIAIPVSVSLKPEAGGLEFENDVLVALSKQGCNSGACHGSPSGKGGFRLSLRAFDKLFDEQTLTSEFAQRRINTVEPEESLLLQKGIMKTAHGGGVQMRSSDFAYGVLRDWIATGAKLDRPETTRCVKLEVHPSINRTYLLKNGKVPLMATAHFGNGLTRDVSKLVAYESSNTNVATVSANGIVEPLVQGETVILVRFLEHIESVPMVFIDPKESFQWIAQPVLNPIDSLVDTKLQMMEINSSPICSDEAFVRRVYMDVLGELPSVAQSKSFVESQLPTKRSDLIDELLEHPQYASFWALKWSDLLRVTAKGLSEEGVYKYHRWIEQAVRENMPYDQFAKQLLASSGGTFTNPPANFYRTAKDMNDSVETVSQVFLGARLQCARCHNHPFERWTQDNYYGLGAFFNRIERTPSARPNEIFVRATQAGDVVQPRTNQVMTPWAPGLDSSVLMTADRREQFAQWLIEPSNPYFARVEANRIWSHLFARGIVDPIDDFRDSNPPTNKPLLDALAQKFTESGYDRKALIRFILNSRTYQTSSSSVPTNEHDSLYFSRQEPRLLTAEQLFDAIVQLTGTTHDFSPLPAGTKATAIPSPDVVKVDFLRIFGQPERSTVCACERADDSSLGMAIELFNGSTVHDKLKDPNNLFRSAMSGGKPVQEVIELIYQTAFSRNPDSSELEFAMSYCAAKEDKAAGLEDLCWAIINSDEFLFQH